MNKVYIRRSGAALIMTLVMLVVGFSTATAQRELSKKERQDALATIISDYSNWGKASMDGKLRTDLLPVSVTVKVYMEKNKFLQISMRAPMLGEVVRMEVTPDTLIVANRMKKIYIRESFADTDLFSSRDKAQNLLGQLQSLLLGRVVLFGNGELGKKNADKMNFYSDPAGGWMLIPVETTQSKLGEYGYLCYTDGRLRGVMVDIAQGKLMVSAGYSYPGDTQILLDARTEGKQYGVTLTMQQTKFGGKGLERFTGKGYRLVSPREFINNIM